MYVSLSNHNFHMERPSKLTWRRADIGGDIALNLDMAAGVIYLSINDQEARETIVALEALLEPTEADLAEAFPLDDPCPICGGDHDRITREDCPEYALSVVE